MIENLPTYIELSFGFTTILTLLLFVRCLKKSTSETVRKQVPKIFMGLIFWLMIQGTITILGIYSSDTESLPPKIVLLGILPPAIFIVILLTTQRGRNFTDSLPLKELTYLNVVRVPVELVLFFLFLNGAVPELMTFEGRNFDILAGVTAPIMVYLVFTKQKLGSQVLFIWNLACLGLLLNIVVHAFLSAPSPLQRLAFEQPNIAILHFPFSWLPTFIVPLVLFGHLVSLVRAFAHSPYGNPR